MLHITCDVCGKEIRATAEPHFVVKMEVFSSQDPNELTEADLDDDHLEAVGELIRDMEDDDAAAQPVPASQRLRYDLCAACRQKFVRDPLGKEVQKFDFSEN